MENIKAKAFDLRKDTVDIIVAGNGGHIGGDMSAIDILISLYFCQMNISPDRLEDPDRDRFVLSKGHSVEAYYAVLAAKGFLNLEDVKANFSKFGSSYIGHPNNKLPGIEMNSGSLGHGLPVCVGMALAGKWTKNHIVFIQLWEMVSWQRVLCGKALWLAININSIIYAQLLIGIIFKFLEIQRMLWDMKSFQSVLVHLAGM